MSQVTSSIPEIRRVPVKDIRLDRAYQRDAQSERVEQLVANWDPKLAGLVIVSHRADVLFGVDGQHRIAAMIELGIEQADCHVLEGLTQREEAELFVLYNSSSKHLSGWDKWKAQLCAQDPAAIEIQATVQATGFRLVGIPGSFDHIQALAAVRRIYAVGGKDLLRLSLNTIRSVWNGDRRATSAAMMGGLAAFLWAFNDEDTFEFDRLSTIMEKIPPVKFIRRGAEIRYERVSGKASAFAVAEAIREEYNAGRSRENQLGVLTHRNVSRAKIHGSPRPKPMVPGSRRSRRAERAAAESTPAA